MNINFIEKQPQQQCEESVNRQRPTQSSACVRRISHLCSFRCLLQTTRNDRSQVKNLRNLTVVSDVVTPLTPRLLQVDQCSSRISGERTQPLAKKTPEHWGNFSFSSPLRIADFIGNVAPLFHDRKWLFMSSSNPSCFT